MMPNLIVQEAWKLLSCVEYFKNESE